MPTTPTFPIGPPLVVLVEDDLAVLNALSFAFEVEGYSVRAYASAEAMLAESMDGEGLCLVIDEKLPGISGLDLVARLRASGVAAPAILITSNPPERYRKRAVAAGVSIIEKPLLGDALLTMVCDALSRGETGA